MSSFFEDKIQNGTPLVIPVSGDAYTTQRVTLDGRAFTLRLSWNQYVERWFLSISDVEDVPIVHGICVQSNWPLLRYYGFDPRLPPGEMIAQDLTGDGSPPGLTDFGEGKRVVLTYYAQT